MKTFFRIFLLFGFVFLTFACGSSRQAPSGGKKSPPATTETPAFIHPYLQSGENFDNINTCFYQGLLIDGTTKIPVSCFFQKNQSLIVSVKYQGKDVFPLFFTENQHYKWTGEAYVPLDAGDIARVREILPSGWYFKAYQLYRDRKPFNIYERKKILNGQEVSVIKSREGDTNWYFYFEHQHGLLVKMEREHDGQIDMNVEFMDFRTAEGIELPYYWLIRLPGNQEKEYKAIWKNIRPGAENPFSSVRLSVQEN